MHTSLIFDWVAIVWFFFVGFCMMSAGALIWAAARRESDWGVRLVFTVCAFAISWIGVITIVIALGGFNA